MRNIQAHIADEQCSVEREKGHSFYVGLFASCIASRHFGSSLMSFIERHAATFPFAHRAKHFAVPPLPSRHCQFNCPKSLRSAASPRLFYAPTRATQRFPHYHATNTAVNAVCFGHSSTHCRQTQDNRSAAALQGIGRVERSMNTAGSRGQTILLQFRAFGPADAARSCIPANRGRARWPQR